LGIEEGAGQVILRVIRGRASRDELRVLDAALETTLTSEVRDQRGPTRFHLASRPTRAGAGESGDDDLEVIMISLWSSAEAAASRDAGATSPLSIARRQMRDLSVAHFEIDEPFIRQPNERPIWIRLATGRFSKHGADLQMQELLRQRAPLIGEEMTEAYVGRRLVGRAVEVTFVSAWNDLPNGQRLEEALWPDIALRYDEFVVEVYQPIGVE
jgi:hypothetical protein